MIVLSPSKEELRAASFVAHSSDLKRVVLLHVSTEGDPREVLRSKAKNVGVDFDMKSFVVTEPGKLAVEVAVSVILGHGDSTDCKETNPDETQLRFNTVFLAEYEIPVEPIPENVGKEALERFSRLNGLTNCWPYVRAEIQHITTAMGLPPFTLPLMTVRAESSKEAKKD